MSTLDDVLNDEVKKVEEVKEVKEVKEEKQEVEVKEVKESVKEVKEPEKETGTPARGEDGKFVKQESKQEVKESKPKNEKVEVRGQEPEKSKETKQEMSERERAFLAAAHDERVKRQALEKRIAELQGQAQPKTFWDDPEGALKNFEQQIQTVAVNTRLNTAESIARSKYQDFDENVNVFAQLLQSTPGLHQQWLQSADPAEFAYRTGKSHREISQFGGLDKWRDQKEKEIRLKLEQEYKEKLEQFEKDKAAIPGSLSASRGTGSTNHPVYNGPTPLENILRS